MLVDLLAWFVEESNTAQHIFLRTAAAGLTAFVLGLVLGPWVLKLLFRVRSRAPAKRESEVLDELSKDKVGTPIMGGWMAVPPLAISLLLWGNLQNSYVQLAILGTVGFCLIGTIDDYIKLRYPERKGMTSLAKLTFQCLVSGALSFALLILLRALHGDELHNPLLDLSVPFTEITFDLSVAFGLPFLLLSTLIIVGTSNGVNLADGLDGLAPGCVLIASVAMAVIAILVGRPDFSDHFEVQHVAGAQEMAIVASALAGSTMAFLWFNAFPAQVFLGDTGSLPLGGLLGYIAIVSKQELLLPVVGGVFVIETLSVILQVGSYKLRRKRIFRCAPIHHHFQFAGAHEVKIVIRFWIVGLVCAALGLVVLRIG